MCVCYVWEVLCVCKEPERASDSPGTRVTGGYEQPTEEDANPTSLQEHHRASLSQK